jgi:hypothetical protein
MTGQCAGLNPYPWLPQVIVPGSKMGLDPFAPGAGLAVIPAPAESFLCVWLSAVACIRLTGVARQRDRRFCASRAHGGPEVPGRLAAGPSVARPYAGSPLVQEKRADMQGLRCIRKPHMPVFVLQVPPASSSSQLLEGADGLLCSSPADTTPRRSAHSCLATTPCCRPSSCQASARRPPCRPLP